MRFARRLAKRTPLEVELRTVETADALHGVLAPRGWTSPRVESWLDWAETTLAGDGEPAQDGLLAGGPERFARAAAAKAATLGLFDRKPDGSAFQAELQSLLSLGLAAFGRGRPLDAGGEEEVGGVGAGGGIVDADEGGGGEAARLAAADQHGRVAALQEGGEAGAGDGGDEDVAAHRLGPHGVEILVLDLRPVVGVAEDHDVAGVAQRRLGRSGDGAHRRVVEVGHQHGDEPALAAAERPADRIGPVAVGVDQRLDPRHGVRVRPIQLAVGDPRHGRDRNPGARGDQGERSAASLSVLHRNDL